MFRDLKFLRYYTVWALILHLMHVVGMLPSTFVIAILVFIYALLWNAAINPIRFCPQYLCIDILLHQLPFIMFVLCDDVDIVLWPALLSITVYMCVFPQADTKHLYMHSDFRCFDMWN
jgi:hypothetical protein